MAWQMYVLVAQLVLGGGLVVFGARMAAHYWLAYTNKDHAERLAKALGKPAPHSLRPVVAGIALMLIGGLLLATTDMTAGMLLPDRL